MERLEAAIVAVAPYCSVVTLVLVVLAWFDVIQL
jgi:hypothetical protein